MAREISFILQEPQRSDKIKTVDSVAVLQTIEAILVNALLEPSSTSNIPFLCDSSPSQPRKKNIWNFWLTLIFIMFQRIFTGLHFLEQFFVCW